MGNALETPGEASEGGVVNHQMAREVIGVRSLIPATAGRPGAAGPTGHYRRLMRRVLKAGPGKKCLGNAGKPKPLIAWSSETWDRPVAPESPGGGRRICSCEQSLTIS